MSRSPRPRRRALALSGLFASSLLALTACAPPGGGGGGGGGSTTRPDLADGAPTCGTEDVVLDAYIETGFPLAKDLATRSEEHTSELQSRQYIVCRLLLEKNKTTSLVLR